MPQTTHATRSYLPTERDREIVARTQLSACLLYTSIPTFEDSGAQGQAVCALQRSRNMAEKKTEESEGEKIAGAVLAIALTAIAAAVGSAFKRSAAIYERVKDPTHPRHGLVHTIYTVPALGIGFGLLLAGTMDDP